MARVRGGLEWWRVLTLIAAGGVVGATCRHVLSRALDDGALPWGTLLANVAGSAALGVVVRLAARHPREPWWYPLVGVGALGALTTMSSFQVEVVLLVDDGRALAAGAYVVLSVALGLAAAWCGSTSVRRPSSTA